MKKEGGMIQAKHVRLDDQRESAIDHLASTNIMPNCVICTYSQTQMFLHVLYVININ